LNPKIDVEHIAKLAKLMLTEKEKGELQYHLERMLEYVKILEEVDVNEVEPMAYPHNATQRMEKDEPRHGLPRDEALRIAPEESFFLYKVPSPLKDIR